MSRMSINFDNEEQYNNFIQSIKDEVLKEIPKKRHNNYGHAVKNCTTWNYAKVKVEELELQEPYETQLKQAMSIILRFGFKTHSVHFMPDRDFEEVKPSIDRLFDSIMCLRKHKRPEAYQENWVIKEERK